MDKLTASEALYGFCGWITTRKKKVCASEKEDASVWAELCKQFIETNNLETPRDNWPDYLTYPKEPQ